MKALLYEHVARIGKAVSSPKRLEILELLVQGEKPVETLAEQTGMDVRLTSAHLRSLREARLVETRREGKYIHYRLSGPDVTQLWVALRETAEEHLVELRVALNRLTRDPERLCSENKDSLLRKARNGEVVVLDVRPTNEYEAGHLPFARSIPLNELEDRLAELPTNCPIVAYCRGAFCMMSEEAVHLLHAKGFAAMKSCDGFTEWSVSGLPIETGTP